MAKELRPFVNIPVGDFIQEELEAQNWRQEDLANILGVSLKTVSYLMKGRQSVTLDLARLLSKAFGQSPQYWLNLDTNYRLRLRDISAEEAAVATKARIFAYMPVREMIRKGWLSSYRDIDGLAEQVKRFWGRKKIDFAFLDREPLPCFRSAEVFTQRRSYAQTWLQMARLSASTFKVPSLKRRELEKLSSNLASYTTDPERIGDFLGDLNAVGVKFFVLPHLRQTYIDGSAFYDGRNPVIVYTQRHDRIDNFWFTMAHEIVHLLEDVTRRNDAVIDNLENLGTPGERQVNRKAERILGIHKMVKFFAAYRYVSERRVIEYSRVEGMHPGIIVGGLQHHDKLSKKNLNRFKMRVSPHIPDRYYAEKRSSPR